MEYSGPVAIINGIDKFGAKFLAKELLKKDIYVVGVGEFVLGMENNKNFKWVGKTDDYEGKISYVFDFEGDEGLVEMVSKNAAKLTVVCVNNSDEADKAKKYLKTGNFNWRLVESYGVYGPGMADEGKNNLGINFLTEAILAAVKNVNLNLPSLGIKYRLLNVVDLVEVVLKASFLSGTEKNEYLIYGGEIDSGEVAKVLIDEAKMTKFKVLQKDYKFEYPSKFKMEEEWKRLRWQPEVDFKEGVAETLQYFFSVIDEENRKKIRKGEAENSSKFIKLVKEKEGKGEKEDKYKRFEVLVEEEEDSKVNKVESLKAEKVEVVDVEKESGGRRAEEYKKEIEEEFDEAKQKEEKKKAEEKRVEDEEIRSLAKKYIEPAEDEVVEEEEKIETKNELKVESYKVESNKTGKRKWKIGKINFKKVGILLIILLGVGVFSIPVRWGMAVAGGIKSVSQVKKYIEEKKYVEADKKAEAAFESLKRIDNQIDDWSLNRVRLFRNLQAGLKVGEEILTIERKAIPVAVAMGNINEAIFKDKEIIWASELSTLNSSLIDVDTEIGLLQARLNGDWSWLPTRFRPEMQNGIKSLNTARLVIETSKKGLGILKEMVGVDGKRREYLVLFQNENELRAGGGYIGSYGMLSFEGGKLLNLEIRDIYEADGQLKGHVEPPAEIKQYLGEAGWFMRDSNWKVDFIEANKDIEWFLEKETGRKADGVIGVDLAVARAVLEVTGPIFVTDFNEKINKDNLYEQAQFYAENKFFPGSKQKASFLGGLGVQLFEEIKNLDSKRMLQLYTTVLDQLDRNEIQMVLHEKTAAKIVAELGWDGAVYQGKCSGERCYADYLYLSESNFGVNKANFYIYRSVEQTVDITQMAISRVLKINYENTSKNKSWPGGDYKNYLRAYIPADANLAEVSISDPAKPGTKTVVSGADLKLSQLYGKKEIGFLVLVPVGEKRIVEIRYVNKTDLGTKDKFSYLGYVQKQPGYGDTGFVSLISFPPGWQPIQVQPAANVVNGKLLFNTKLERDIKMGVELGK